MRILSKKVISILLIIIFTMSAFTVSGISASASENSCILGDVNLDGKIYINDVTAIQLYLAKLTSLNNNQTYLANVNGDSRLNIVDATYLQMFLAKINGEYPANEDGFVINDKVPCVNGELIINTKSKIYGVSFDTSSTSTLCTRIEDAENLQSDYVVANEFQNGGRNDFDNVYPWSEIRRCNVIAYNDGTKSITYEGEEGFALDGSNGDVMVEIPKFYSAREIKKGKEIWAVTGEPKIGFDIEPAFLDNNGNELDHIYVGAYEYSDSYYGSKYSVSGKSVSTALWLGHYRDMAKYDNMTCMDYATVHALQFLYVIEFADRDTDKYMQGYSQAPFFYYNNNPIQAMSDDRMTVTVGFTADRIRNLSVGQNVSIIRDALIQQGNLTVTSINVSDDDTTAQVTFDIPITDYIEDITTGNYYIAGQGQATGTCDSLTYHTGRIRDNNTVSTFRYRYIENIWGNVWTLLEGIRVKDLKYYYTFNTDQYGDPNVDNWIEAGYAAPSQPYLGDDGFNRAWISEMGYDAKNPLVALPSAVSTMGGTDKFYSSAVYTYSEPGAEYLCTYGGGYDHNILCGPFTMRFWFTEGTELAALHSSRIVYRK